MRILITGASGQIGSNLGLRCLAAGHHVWGVDTRPNIWVDAFPTMLHDLTDPSASQALIAAQRRHGRPDLVVHLAAHAKVHKLVLEPRLALENIAMVQQALEYCRSEQLPVIFASSREVYGNVIRETTQEDDADFAQAASPYAASKIAGEALVRSYGRCYGLPWLIFRLSNVYGRYDNDTDRMERVIPLFARKLIAAEPLTVYGADKVLDFTHVDDCVAGLTAGIDQLTAGSIASETFNLACGQGHSLLQMAHWLAEALGRQPDIRLAPNQVGEVTRYVANISKARRVLGYEPVVPLRHGLNSVAAATELASATGVPKHTSTATTLRAGQSK